MLLKFIRRHTKLLFITILSLMVVPFLFWGVGSIGKQAGEKREPLKVRGRDIPLARLRESGLDSQILLLADFIEGNNIKTAEQFDMYKDWFNKMMNQIDLNKIAIQQILLQDEARRYGLTVSKEELTGWIENFPLFQLMGSFSIERYNAIITNYFRTWPSRFEKGATNVLLVKKLRGFIMDSVLVSQREAYEAYKERNEKAEVYYIEFNPQDYIKDAGEITDIELKDYYNGHSEEFREPEKIKIAYLLFDPAAFKEQVTVTQKEIEDYYKEKKYEKLIDEVKNEITEAITRQKTADLCREKGLEISIELTEEKRLSDMVKLAIEKGLTLKETDFLSKEQGFIQELGWAQELIQTAWRMDLETVSDLLHIGEKWVIISPKQKKETVIPPIDEVKGRITDILKNKKAEELAKLTAKETLNKLPEDLPFTMAVRSLGLKPKKSKAILMTDELFRDERKIVKTRKFYPINEEKWKSEKEGFVKTYMEEKKRRFFQEWLKTLLS